MLNPPLTHPRFRPRDTLPNGERQTNEISRTEASIGLPDSSGKYITLTCKLHSHYYDNFLICKVHPLQVLTIDWLPWAYWARA